MAYPSKLAKVSIFRSNNASAHWYRPANPNAKPQLRYFCYVDSSSKAPNQKESDIYYSLTQLLLIRLFPLQLESPRLLTASRATRTRQIDSCTFDTDSKELAWLIQSHTLKIHLRVFKELSQA